jgi:DNA-directed RNA polymerase specialized sigma24 family protein
MARAKDDRQTLTAARFAELLARLDTDPAQAGLEYERLRRSLIRFFDWRGGWPADECADECLDRLARRLGEDAPVLDVRQFAHGIARLVLLERRRQPAMSSLDHTGSHRGAEIAAPVEPADPAEHDALIRCFDRCLSEMPAESRALLIGYYEGETDRKIANRRRLSTSMGLSENALRSRVQRLRDRLEACIHVRLSASTLGKRGES